MFDLPTEIPWYKIPMGNPRWALREPFLSNCVYNEDKQESLGNEKMIQSNTKFCSCRPVETTPTLTFLLKKNLVALWMG